MEEKKVTTAENADSTLNESEMNVNQDANAPVVEDKLINESEFAQGENSYVLEDIDESAQDDDNIIEVQNDDFIKWNDYNLDEIKSEALNFIQNVDDLNLTGQALKKLRELHNTKLEIEYKKLSDLADNEPVSIEYKELLDKKAEEFNAIWGLYLEKRKDHFYNIAK